MSAFVVFQLTPRDPRKLAEYSAKAMPVLAAAGGEALGLGQLTALQGDSSFQRGAVFEFPDRAAALTWYGGAEYQALTALRGEAMDCSIILIG